MNRAGSVSVSTKKRYTVGEPIEIVASYTETMSNPAEGFEILPIDPDSGELDEELSPISFRVDFRGVDLTSFSFVVALELEQGFYELRPARAVDDPEPTFFVVVERADAP